MLKRSGFTLVELLIVISIIAILSMVGLVSYSNFLKNSRDSKRQSDLKLIQSALEEYHSDQIFYPSSITFGSPLTNLTGRPTLSPVPSTKPYLNTTPVDPNPSPYPQYSYSATSISGTACDNSTTKCQKYCLYAQTEVATPTTDSACPAPSPPYNFGVTRP